MRSKKLKPIVFCLHLAAFGCEQCKEVVVELLDTLKATATALRESSADRGLVAGHGDALDNALKLISKHEGHES